MEVRKKTAYENIKPEVSFCPKITFGYFTLRFRLIKIPFASILVRATV